MMFHVKLLRSFRAITAFTCVFVMVSCVGSRPAVQITDYVLVPNGMENVSGKPLTAFIFENNLRNTSIERFLNAKLKTESYSDKEYWITIGSDRFKLILYDNAEFEKYFATQNFVVTNLEPENATTGTQRKFIALSMVTANNEDSLNEYSLYHNIATNYLKALKDDYYTNGDN